MLAQPAPVAEPPAQPVTPAVVPAQDSVPVATVVPDGQPPPEPAPEQQQDQFTAEAIQARHPSSTETARQEIQRLAKGQDDLRTQMTEFESVRGQMLNLGGPAVVTPLLTKVEEIGGVEFGTEAIDIFRAANDPTPESRAKLEAFLIQSAHGKTIGNALLFNRWDDIPTRIKLFQDAYLQEFPGADISIITEELIQTLGGMLADGSLDLDGLKADRALSGGERNPADIETIAELTRENQQLKSSKPKEPEADPKLAARAKAQGAYLTQVRSSTDALRKELGLTPGEKEPAEVAEMLEILHKGIIARLQEELHAGEQVATLNHLIGEGTDPESSAFRMASSAMNNRWKTGYRSAVERINQRIVQLRNGQLAAPPPPPPPSPPPGQQPAAPVAPPPAAPAQPANPNQRPKPPSLQDGVRKYYENKDAGTV